MRNTNETIVTNGTITKRLGHDEFLPSRTKVHVYVVVQKPI